MISAPQNRLPIYIGAWLATAVATFCLGRITAGNLKESAKAGGSKAGGAVVTADSSLSGGSRSGSGTGTGSSEDIIARVFGGHTVSLDQVLGGKTLEDHLKNLLKVDDEAVRMLGFLRLLEALNDPEDIKTALELIGKEGGGRFRMTEQSMLLQKWAQMDPKAAATFASAQRDFSRFTGMNAVLRTWLKANPEEAIAWAEANGVQNAEGGDRAPGRGGPEDGNLAIATLIGPLAQQNLERALELAKAQPESRVRGRMIDTLVDELLAQRGMDATRSMIADLPDDAFRAGMAGRLAEKMMANSSPNDAATWASNLPAGATREQAMAEVIRRWADDKPVEAGTFLQGLGNSPDWDDARQRYAMELVREHPMDSMTWAQSITDAKQRQDAVQRLLRDWMRRDMAAAQAFAVANGIQLQAGPTGGPRFGGGGGPGER
jgi:hypothetical protein